MVQTHPVFVFFLSTHSWGLIQKVLPRGGCLSLPLVEKNAFFMKNPDKCDVWQDFLKRNLTCSSCLLRPSYLGPPISDLTANDSLFFFFFLCMVTPQEQGITEIRTCSGLPDFLIIQGGSVFHGMPLVQGYEGNAVFRNALPSHEMPWKTLQVQRYEGNSIFRNALLSHEIFHFRT